MRRPSQPAIQPEMKVKLRQPLRVRGIIWPRGLVIPLPKPEAQRLIRMEVADPAPAEEQVSA
jgi:hypothetical protein